MASASLEFPGRSVKHINLPLVFSITREIIVQSKVSIHIEDET